MLFGRVISVGIGYLCGMFLSGFLYGKKENVDLRKVGSGNVGTTNTMRNLGVKAGILTLIGDVCKVFMAMVIVWLIFRNRYPDSVKVLELYAGVGCILGHDFPAYMKFKGGKGIAVSFGSLLGLIPMWYPVLSLAGCFLFFSLVIQISPNFYRTVAVYIVNWLIIVFSETNLPKAVHIGVGLISLLILLKMHMSQEEREKMTFQLLWIKR